METVKVYQIGVGSFGRFGFEKLVEMHNHLNDINVVLKGVCEHDMEKLEAARKFAESNGIEVETFEDVEEMYNQASHESEQILIYDAGPPEFHSENISRSMNQNFFHLAEKPPSMTREEHLEEKRLAEDRDVMWKVDFVERENPVVRKALKLVEGKDIDEIKVFRESSVGIEKMISPVERLGVQGGDILDKMIHEVYVTDFLEASGNEVKLELENAETEFFVPKNPGSEKLLSVDSGYTEEVNDDTATGMTEAVFSSGDTEIRLHSSWLGMSRASRHEASRIEDKTGSEFFNRSYRQMGEKSFVDEEARFFVIEGEKNLAGDMLNMNLFDLETGEEIDLDYRIHDQLYRIIEKAVRNAAGEDVADISGKEIDVFMNALFDAREEVVGKDYDFIEELEKADGKVDKMIVEDKKVREPEESEKVAG